MESEQTHAHHPRFKANPEAHRQILSQFIEAAKTGELEGLLQYLSSENSSLPILG